MTKKKFAIYAKALIAILITILLIIYSESVFSSAVDGLNIWWTVVFPALLPFFIMAEILMGLGVVDYMGTLLEPLMRPLFRIPGVGAFALAMGLASGYPIGAKITGNLRRNNMCTKTEAERLISFANTADPLFMVGAVAVGMLKRPELGFIIAIAHYLACITVGLIFRFYKPNAPTATKHKEKKQQGNIFKRAANNLYQSRKDDQRSLGEILGDSIKESVETLLLIGGFIILFSVLTEIIALLGIDQLFKLIISSVLGFLGLEESLILPLISGIFEITNGSNLTSQSIAPLSQKLIIISSVIAWSGISVHAQVAAMVKGTDISLKPYLIARIIHSLLAGLYTYLIYTPSQTTFEKIPVLSEPTSRTLALEYPTYLTSMFSIFIIILAITTIVSLLIYLFKGIHIFYYRYK